MEVSNKTLSILVLLAIGVSLLGVLFSGGNEITGAQTATTDTGTVNLSITQKTTIIFVNDTVDFGAGYVNRTADNCYMDTEGAMQDATSCVDWTNVTQGLSFRNDGNTNLSVQINFSKTSAAFVNDVGANAGAQFKIADDFGEGQLDDTIASCGDNWLNYTSYSDFTTTPEYICGDAASYPLGPDNDEDDAVLDFNVTVTNQATVEAKGVFVYLIGTSAE